MLALGNTVLICRAGGMIRATGRPALEFTAVEFIPYGSSGPDPVTIIIS